MNSIQLYSNESFSVRTTRDANGTVWFVGKDIAEALEYTENTIKQVNNLFSAVPIEWKGHKRIMTPGGEQDMICLTEQGVYFFLGRSDKPKALPYQMWIAGDVVPSIMHTGSYTVNKQQTALPSGVLEGAKLIYETAGITGNQMTLALDKLYKSYTGQSALEGGNVTLNVEPQHTSREEELWKHIVSTFALDEWFTSSELRHTLGRDALSIRQIVRYLSSFVAKKMLSRRGSNKNSEYIRNC